MPDLTIQEINDVADNWDVYLQHRVPPTHAMKMSRFARAWKRGWQKSLVKKPDDEHSNATN